MNNENFSLFLLLNIIFCKRVKAYRAVRLGLDWTSQADLRLEFGSDWFDIFKPSKWWLELGLGLCGILVGMRNFLFIIHRQTPSYFLVLNLDESRLLYLYQIHFHKI
jgi:hypothetical protein